MNLDDEPDRDPHIQIYEDDRMTPRDSSAEKPTSANHKVIMKKIDRFPRLEANEIHELICDDNLHDVTIEEVRWVMLQVERGEGAGGQAAS